MCLVLARILASGYLKRRPLVAQACRRRLLENVAARDLAVQRPILGKYQPPRSLAVVSHLPGTDTSRELAALPTILGTCCRSSLPFPVLRTRVTYRLRLWSRRHPRRDPAFRVPWSTAVNRLYAITQLSALQPSWPPAQSLK